MADGIELTMDGSVARLLLNRPARRNAFDLRMLTAWEDAIAALERDPAVEIAVMTGAGEAFCAGTDLQELEGLDAEDTRHVQSQTARAVERWARLEATTVTAFNGPAIGAGAIIGLASDLRVAVDTAFFAFPETSLGIPLTWSGVPVLLSLLGADRTRQLLLLSETLDVEEIVRLGLVMAAVPTAELEGVTETLVERLAEAPQSARLMAKRAVHAAAAAPGFVTNAYEPFLASLSIHMRGGKGIGSKER